MIMKKLKVLSIGLLFSCVQMHAADADENRGVSPATVAADTIAEVDGGGKGDAFALAAMANCRRKPKTLTEEEARNILSRNVLHLRQALKDRRDAVALAALDDTGTGDKGSVDPLGTMGTSTTPVRFGHHVRGCRNCCGKVWTGTVWLVTSLGSLLGGTVDSDKKKQ